MREALAFAARRIRIALLRPWTNDVDAVESWIAQIIEGVVDEGRSMSSVPTTGKVAEAIRIGLPPPEAFGVSSKSWVERTNAIARVVMDLYVTPEPKPAVPS